MKLLAVAGLAVLAVTMAAQPSVAGDDGRNPHNDAACCTPHWTGFYVGGSIGYSHASTNFDHTYEEGAYFGSDQSDVSGDGVIGTISLGYDRSLHNNLVVGVFGDYTFGELDGDGNRSYPSAPFSVSHTLELEDSWAVGARLGLARSCCSLWYVTAGYTETELGFSDLFGTLKTDLNGYFLGAGVEQKLHDGFSIKFEYRYSDYGDETIYELAGGCVDCYERFDVETETHAIRLGLAYKFGRHRETTHAPLK